MIQKLLQYSLAIAWFGIVFSNQIQAQNQKMPREKLQEVLNKNIDNKEIFGNVVFIRKGNDQWIGSAGNIVGKSPYFIASTTKLYISALIFQLCAEGRLRLDDPIGQYLPREIMMGLHIYKGKDYSEEITIKHLLAQTSGLPDYFQGKKNNGKSILKELEEGKDQAWTFEEAIQLSKTMKPLFRPGTKKKAHYSDTNFQLLGKIIEHLLSNKIQNVLQQRICKPLNLKRTYMYTDPTDKSVPDIYFGGIPLNMPLAMSSFKADGGIVSNAEECGIFLQAFMNGTLFPVEYLQEAQIEWNAVFFPIKYGIGIMKFKLPRIFSPFKSMPELIGHSGLSGAFSFYYKEKDIFICGTVNQIKNPSNSYKLMLKLIEQIQ